MPNGLDLLTKPFGARGRVLTFGQTVDAVVEHADVQVHVAAYLVNKVVSADSQAIAIARHLPNGQFRMARLDARSDRATASVYGVESVGVQVVGHTATATDTRYHSHLMGRYADLGHRFLQGHADGMVAASWTKTYVLI